MSCLIKGDLEVSNFLIVESDGDKFFIEALLVHMNLDIEVGSPICAIDEFECIGGMSKLNNKLQSLKRRVQKESIDKIGIIFDADEVGIEKRTIDIKREVTNVFGEEPTVEFKPFIMHVDGKGELEDILKIIKTEESLYADCLESWKICLSENKREVSDKVFNKFWINNYIMYDTCTSSKHRGRKSKYCIFEYAMKEKKIWDFDNPILKELKSFLKEIGEN
ncbi:MAG: Unknown protein [uncultured Sulfurovum sp.]|uniref:DUF4435 domain-containing protein n=1 Tax=uncultured Sulfurovum sp. TaxID=269237 RepID=A0A6S6TVR5_9BACT|nr:MAG: Unknown protein [uncultured Sulfurovum sp.]